MNKIINGQKAGGKCPELDKSAENGDSSASQAEANGADSQGCERSAPEPLTVMRSASQIWRPAQPELGRGYTPDDLMRAGEMIVNAVESPGLPCVLTLAELRAAADLLRAGWGGEERSFHFVVKSS